MTTKEVLLVTMSLRAAYMKTQGEIEFPSQLERLVEFVNDTIVTYMAHNNLNIGVSFDDFINAALKQQYGVNKEIPKEIDISEFDKLTICMSSMLDELKKVIKRPDGIVDSVNYALYKSIQYLELQILELDRRTR